MANSPAWTRKEGKNPEGGLNEKGRASLRAAGHDIKRPQPEGGARKDSFCARMKGMKAKLTSSETANDPDSRINKSLRKWNCHADGGAIDVARQYRDTGGRSNSYDTLKDLMKRKSQERDEVDTSSKDPTRNVTPEEYRRGNLGRGYYALAKGGRASYALGGTPAEQIANIYQDFLGRSASPEEITNAQKLLQGGKNIDQYAIDVSNSPEAINYGNRAFISSLYNNLLGRDPDEAGLQGWVNQLGSGKVNWQDVSNAFQNSEEAKQFAANNSVPYQVAGPAVKPGVVYPNFTAVDPERVQNAITGMGNYDIPNVAREIMNAPDIKYNLSRLKSIPITQSAVKNTWGDPSKSSQFDWTNSVAFARALEQSGIPRQAALAIAGNAGIESAAGQYGQQLWDVKEAGGKGPGVGSLQFTYPSRKEDFLNVSQKYGGPGTMAGNVAAIANEMKNPEYARMVKAAANAGSLQDATAIIGRYYENPNRAALYKSLPQRIAYAQQLLPQYEAYAAKYPYAPPPVTIDNAPLPTSRPDQSILDQLAASGAGGNVSAGIGTPIAPTISNPAPAFNPSYSGGWEPPALQPYVQPQPYVIPPGTNWWDQTGGIGSGGAGGAGSIGGGSGGGGGGGVGVGGGSVGSGGFSVGFGPGLKDGGAVDIARAYRKSGGPVWDKPRPKSLGKPEKLTPGEKSSAKAAAKAAGRPYPNLVDNMRAAREEGGRLRPFMEAKIEEIGDKELGKYGIGPNAPSSTKDELKAGPEQSTWESIASKAMGDRPSPERRRFVEGMGNIADVGHMGAYATPLAPYVGAADFARGVASGDPMEAALGATGLPGKGAKAVGVAASAMMPDEAQAGPLSKALNAIRAYHGSPHKFDKFDISKIGTGEGAQAYGHGLYFAQNPAVAQEYRSRLAGRPEIKSLSIAGHRVGPFNSFDYSPKGSSNYENLRSSLFEDMLINEDALVADPKNAQKLASDILERKIKDLHEEWPEAVPDAKRLLTDINRTGGVGLRMGETPGAMYEVDIHAPKEHLLDWDRPISEQSPIIQEFARAAKPTSPRSRSSVLLKKFQEGNEQPSYPLTGEQLHINLSRADNSPEISNKMREFGIPGIKYLDQGSRPFASGDGTSNYVVFDPNIIEILRRYKNGGYVPEEN